MKLVKKLVVLVAALTMALGLVACGGDSFPKTYTFSEPRGEGEQKATLTLNEDGTYVYEFTATNSNGDGGIAMFVEVKGDYTLDGDTVTCDTAEGEGYYTAGASKTEFKVTKDKPDMYKMTYSQGAWVFAVDGDTFGPVVE